jgi:hypothetical protein
MSYPSQKRRLRPARGIAALVAALMAAGAGLASTAQAVPTPEGASGTIRTMAGMTRNFTQGGYGPDSAPGAPVLAVNSQFLNPRGLNFAPPGSPNAGDVYITDALNHLVRKIDSAGNVSLVAGTVPVNGVPQDGDTGEGVAATSALLREPHGVAVDSKGNVYIADSRNCVIRKVDTAGIITRFAGTGARKPLTNDPYNCDNGTSAADPQTTTNPLSVALDQPKQLFITQDGGKDFLFITDMGNNKLRKMVINNGVAESMTTIAGVRMNNNYQDGDFTQATMRHAEGIWVAADKTVYFTDGGNNLVRKISNGVVSTIAGDKAAATAAALQDGPCDAGNLCGNSDGDGGLAINAHLDEPRGITGDNQGHLFIAEEHGSRIRRINLNTGIIDTIAGDGTVAEQRGAGGTAFIKGENGPALETNFNHLHDMQVNPADGSLWIADSRNNRVRAMPGVTNAIGGNVQTGGNPTTTPTTQPVTIPGKSGYWMLGADGRVWGFGDAKVIGDVVGKMPAGASAVHIEPTPDYGGYWINDDRGGVYSFGNAAPLGGINSSTLQAGEKIVSLSSTPSGQGFWLFTTKGRVFGKGVGADNFGDLANVKLNGAIQSSVATPSGKGYYMVGSDGGVFTFGDAKFWGSTGDIKLNKPVMAVVPTRSGLGYWLVASDGGIFTFGDAGFKGSEGATKLNKPVVGMVRYGSGYLMVAADGGIFDHSGGNGFKGSLGATPPAIPITFAATLDS